MTDKDALQAADKVIEEMREVYLDELAGDLKTLGALAEKFGKAGGGESIEGLADEIYETVKRIRDLGETFGYILVTKIADLFCELIYRQKFASKFAISECLTCIESLKLVSHRSFRDKTVHDAAEICAGIAMIVDKYPKVDRQN